MCVCVCTYISTLYTPILYICLQYKGRTNAHIIFFLLLLFFGLFFCFFLGGGSPS